MKTNNGILLGAAAVGMFLLFRNKNISGIGATKRAPRRIWKEVEQAQKHGIDLTDPNGWKGHENDLGWMAHGKLAKSNSDKPTEQRYFNQLRRAYRSIAGTSLPYEENVVHNDNGDVILIYRDYKLDKLPQDAAEFVYDNAMATITTNPEDSAKWATIALIASGDAKFIWKGDKIHHGIAKEIFPGETEHPEERKRRISYLASKQKGGMYVDEFIHKLWERSDMRVDDHFIRNGVLDALLTVDSRGRAIELCKNEYLAAHQVEEPLLYQDVPF